MVVVVVVVVVLIAVAVPRPFVADSRVVRGSAVASSAIGVRSGRPLGWRR